VDTLGHLLTLHATAANEDERAQVSSLCTAAQAATQGSLELVYADQGYTGPRAAEAAAEHGIKLEIVKLAEAKKGFVLLPRRWVVERTIGWAARFRRLTRDYEGLVETLEGLHSAAFGLLFTKRLVRLAT
jgi:transposase